jgi:hypothetical protein
MRVASPFLERQASRPPATTRVVRRRGRPELTVASDGSRTMRARARWTAGVALIDACPRCGQRHTHAVPAPGRWYLAMKCNDPERWADAYYVVEARPAAPTVRARRRP